MKGHLFRTYRMLICLSVISHDILSQALVAPLNVNDCLALITESQLLQTLMWRLHNAEGTLRVNTSSSFPGPEYYSLVNPVAEKVLVFAHLPSNRHPTARTSGAEARRAFFRFAGLAKGTFISLMQEIDRVSKITKVPKAARFVEDVANLRDEVMPVLDTRKRQP